MSKDKEKPAPRLIINESGYKPANAGSKTPPTSKPQASSSPGSPQAAKK